MTDLQEFRALAVELIGEFGTTCTVTDPNGEWATDGSVTETAVSYASVSCSDLVDESRRYMVDGSTGRLATGTLYLPAEIDFTPAPGHRVTYQARVYSVLEVFPFRIGGGFVAWRLDVCEQGAA